MKLKLMIQSLSPLALLTIINNFSFVTENNYGEVFSAKEFIYLNFILLFVLLFCVIWVILSVWFYIEFKAFQYTDKQSGYDIIIKNERGEDSLNFFLTLILPLLIDDIARWQGASVFFLVLFMICVLLYKTRLFYANPVLSILGYKVVEFEFSENSKVSKKNLIGIYNGKITNNNIMYKTITDTVYYIKGTK